MRSGSSKSTRSISSDESTFRLRISRSAGKESAICQLARKSPGRLLEASLRSMYKLCHPTTSVAGGASIPTLPAAAVQYFHQVVRRTKDVSLKPEEERELETLAPALDLLANGELATLGDLLVQRFKSIETRGRTGSKRLGEAQELLPPVTMGATTLREQEVAAKFTLRSAALEEVIKKG